MWNIKDIIMYIGIKDIIDILIVSYLLYNLYLLIKETRAEQLTKGVIIFLLVVKIAETVPLHLLYWLLKNAMTFGMIALMIVFQPELRRVLEHMGQTRLFTKNMLPVKGYVIEKTIDETVMAATHLSSERIGALIVFERETGLNEIIQTGIAVDALLSYALLNNIFIPNTPLHDGAVIVKRDRVVSAGCVLPLTSNRFLNKELGTRHRAALGISENSDCLALVVSEETGAISIAQSGKLYRDLSAEFLREMLFKNLMSEEAVPKKSLKKGGDKK